MEREREAAISLYRDVLRARDASMLARESERVVAEAFNVTLDKLRLARVH